MSAEMKVENRRLQVVLLEPLAQKLEAAARADDRSVSAFIRRIIQGDAKPLCKHGK
jgi:hypothetical protein